jgi:hypothetical protein
VAVDQRPASYQRLHHLTSAALRPTPPRLFRRARTTTNATIGPPPKQTMLDRRPKPVLNQQSPGPPTPKPSRTITARHSHARSELTRCELGGGGDPACAALTLRWGIHEECRGHAPSSASGGVTRQPRFGAPCGLTGGILSTDLTREAANVRRETWWCRNVE